jgi:hypothetical protein
VVEGNGLENRRASNGTEGSNPSLSAIENTPKSGVFSMANVISLLPREYLGDRILYCLAKIVGVFEHDKSMGFDNRLVARVC